MRSLAPARAAARPPPLKPPGPSPPLPPPPAAGRGGAGGGPAGGGPGGGGIPEAGGGPGGGGGAGGGALPPRTKGGAGGIGTKKNRGNHQLPFPNYRKQSAGDSVCRCQRTAYIKIVLVSVFQDQIVIM